MSKATGATGSASRRTMPRAGAPAPPIGDRPSAGWPIGAVGGDVDGERDLLSDQAGGQHPGAARLLRSIHSSGPRRRSSRPPWPARSASMAQPDPVALGFESHPGAPRASRRRTAPVPLGRDMDGTDTAAATFDDAGQSRLGRRRGRRSPCWPAHPARGASSGLDPVRCGPGAWIPPARAAPPGVGVGAGHATAAVRRLPSPSEVRLVSTPPTQRSSPSSVDVVLPASLRIRRTGRPVVAAVPYLGSGSSDGVAPADVAVRPPDAAGLAAQHLSADLGSWRRLRASCGGSPGRRRRWRIDRALAAAIRPNVYASSTRRVKKSVVIRMTSLAPAIADHGGVVAVVQTHGEFGVGQQPARWRSAPASSASSSARRRSARAQPPPLRDWVSRTANPRPAPAASARVRDGGGVDHRPVTGRRHLVSGTEQAEAGYVRREPAPTAARRRRR